MIRFVQIQLNINFAVTVKLICQTFASIIPFMVICNVTEHLHTRFDGIDIFERCNWYTFSIRIRRIFPVIIQNAQKMDCLNVFGNITVSRETCKLVTQSNFHSNNCLKFDVSSFASRWFEGDFQPSLYFDDSWNSLNFHGWTGKKWWITTIWRPNYCRHSIFNERKSHLARIDNTQCKHPSLFSHNVFSFWSPILNFQLCHSNLYGVIIFAQKDKRSPREKCVE